jgi:hypothetical protein
MKAVAEAKREFAKGGLKATTSAAIVKMIRR